LLAACFAGVGLGFGELMVAGLVAGDGFGDGPAPNAGAASSATATSGTAIRIDMVRDTSWHRSTPNRARVAVPEIASADALDTSHRAVSAESEHCRVVSGSV